MNDNMLNVLSELIQLDYDSVKAYDEILDEIEDEDIYQITEKFKQEHVRHINDLLELMVKLDKHSARLFPHSTDSLMSGFTALRSLKEDAPFLRVIETQEKMSNKSYLHVIENGEHYPNEVKSLLHQNYIEEQRHLDYIKEMMRLLD